MLIDTVEAFLKAHEMAATKFGRLAAHDPRFVLDLRMGRIPRAATEARTRGWMTEYELSARKASRAAGPASGPASVPDCGQTQTAQPAPAAEFKTATKEFTHAA